MVKTDCKKRNTCIYINKLQDIPLTHQFIRSGIIPYTIKDEQLHFMMGIDNKHKEITDFGGGNNITSSFITNAIRELQEESLNIDLQIPSTLPPHSICVYDWNTWGDTIIIFLKINDLYDNFDDLNRVFNRNVSIKKRNKEKVEISEIVLIDEHAMKNLTSETKKHEEQMFPHISCMLHKVFHNKTINISKLFTEN
jgi:hypothetical protein